MSESRTPDAYGEVPAPEDLEDEANRPDQYGEVEGDGERATTNDAEDEYGEVPGADHSSESWNPEGVVAADIDEDDDGRVIDPGDVGVDLHPETTITKPA